MEEATARAAAEKDSITADNNVAERMETNQDGEARRALAPYLAGVKNFLAKQPRTFAELAKEGGNGNMFRGKFALPSGTDTFAQVLRRIFKGTTPTTRYKQFVLLFPDVFTVFDFGESVQLAQDTPTIPSEEARELIKNHGTPIRLLCDYFHEIGANPVLLNGNRCVHRWGHPAPETDANGPLTVVLNFWDQHVFSYESTANKAASTLRVKALDDWDPKTLVSRREEMTHTCTMA